MVFKLDENLVKRANELDLMHECPSIFGLGICLKGDEQLLHQYPEINKLVSFFDKISIVLYKELMYELFAYDLDLGVITEITDFIFKIFIDPSITEEYIKRRVIKMLKKNNNDAIGFTIEHCNKCKQVYIMFTLYLMILFKSGWKFENIDFTSDLEICKSE